MNFKEFPTYFAVISSYIAMFSALFIIFFASPTQKQLIEEGILDFTTLPIFASFPYFTKVLGFITAPIFVQFGINPRLIFVVNALTGVVGYMLIISADSATSIIIGVSLAGYYASILSVYIITYVTEVTLHSQRKTMSAGIGFCIRICLFITYFAGIWLSFRWLAVFGLVIVCLSCFLHLLNPPSPIWYVQQGMYDKAKSTLFYLHGSEFDADAEIDKIKNETLSSKVSWIESMRALKEWKVLKPLLLMCALGLLKELGGHEAMVSFSTRVLENQQAMDPKVASLFYPIFLIAGAILCICILKYCKVKWVLIIASTFQAISHLSMATYYFISENHLHCNTSYSQLCHSLSFWPISNIALFAFSFGFGWGILFYSLLGTLIPTVHKESYVAATTISVNFTSFIVVYVFIYLLQNIGGLFTFLIFSLNNIFSIVFLYFFIKI